MISLNYYWRLFGTGISFTVFGLGGVVTTLTVFPLINLFIRDEATRKRVGQAVVHKTFKWFVTLMAGLGVLDYEIDGLEKIEGDNCLIVANHPSLIDVVFLISLIRQVDCIVKGDLLRNPFTRGPIRAAGYIPNNGSEALIEDCVDSLKSGNSLIIFPEGSRTVPGKPLKFQRGAANIVIRAGVDIRLVTIDVSPTTLTKAEKWYQIPKEKKVRVTIKFGERLSATPFVAETENSTLATRKLTQYLEQYYTKEIAVYE